MQRKLDFVEDHFESPQQPRYLEDAECRNTHMVVLGSSGSGKSKFLEQLIRDDIQGQKGFLLLDIGGRFGPWQELKGERK
jgi:hypothetical protein